MIRTARPDDSAALAGLITQLGYTIAAAALPAQLRLVEAQGDEVLVAEADDGRVVGFAAMHLMRVFHQERPSAYITALATDASARRTGVGRALLQAAEEWARARGCYRLSLTSAEHRSDAHAFYPACGFPQTGRRFGKDL